MEYKQLNFQFRQEELDELEPPCHEDCFHYGMFGWVEGCDAGRFHEKMQPGQKCLYPNLRHICKPIGTFSMLEICAVLEGTPIKLIPKSFENLGQVEISS